MDWTFEEFRTYLLLEAANCDCEYTDEEQAFIKSTIDESGYEAIVKEFHGDTDYQRATKIQDGSDYFSSPEHKAELSKVMQNLFEADGRFDAAERATSIFLKRILRQINM